MLATVFCTVILTSESRALSHLNVLTTVVKVLMYVLVNNSFYMKLSCLEEDWCQKHAYDSPVVHV